MHIAEAIANAHIAGGGEFTTRCEAFLERELGLPTVAAHDVVHSRARDGSHAAQHLGR